MIDNFVKFFLEPLINLFRLRAARDDFILSSIFFVLILLVEVAQVLLQLAQLVIIDCAIQRLALCQSIGYEAGIQVVLKLGKCSFVLRQQFVIDQHTLDFDLQFLHLKGLLEDTFLQIKLLLIFVADITVHIFLILDHGLGEGLGGAP